MPENHGEYVHKVEMTGNIFEETNLPANFFVNRKNLKQSKVLQKASCIATCHKTFTDSDGKKIKGSGWCKAGCWAKTIATVALAVAAIIKATK